MMDQRESQARQGDMNRALRGRLDEFQKLRRDMAGRFSETGARLEQRMATMHRLMAEMEETSGFIAAQLRTIDELSADGWKDETLQSELGAAIRKLEHLRLEILSRNARLVELERGLSGAGETAAEGSLVPELNSLSFRQLFRLGAGFNLFAVIFFLVGSTMIAAAFILAMRV